MIIKYLLLFIVIVILYISVNTVDTFTTSVSGQTEKVKDEDIIKLESIVSNQASELKQISNQRRKLQQNISDIAEIVYTKETTSAGPNLTVSLSPDPTSTSTSS
jgi:hypothetical protein